MVMHGGGGVEADCLANLTHGWRIATVLHALGDDVEDFALAWGEGFRHRWKRTGVRWQGQTPVRRTNVRLKP